MSRRSQAAFFLLITSIATTSRADQVLDQSNIIVDPGADNAIIDSQSLAQTFTVGLDGLLSRVDLQIGRSEDAVIDITFEIRTTNGGLPSGPGSILFSTIIPLDTLPIVESPFDPMPLTSIDVSAANLMVQDGDVLALVLTRLGSIGRPPWATWRSFPETYSRGLAFKSRTGIDDWVPIEFQTSTFDHGFQTFIGPAAVVPEPSTALLLAVGCVLGLPAARHVRRRTRRDRSRD